MRSEVASLIKELEEACRRSLYNGALQLSDTPRDNLFSGRFPESVIPSFASSHPAMKRRRREKSTRNWETVRRQKRKRDVIFSLFF